MVLQSQECFDVSWGIASTAMLEMLFVDGAYSSTMFDGLKNTINTNCLRVGEYIYTLLLLNLDADNNVLIGGYPAKIRQSLLVGTCNLLTKGKSILLIVF